MKPADGREFQFQSNINNREMTNIRFLNVCWNSSKCATILSHLITLQLKPINAVCKTRAEETVGNTEHVNSFSISIFSSSHFSKVNYLQRESSLRPPLLDVEEINWRDEQREMKFSILPYNWFLYWIINRIDSARVTVTRLYVNTIRLNLWYTR